MSSTKGSWATRTGKGNEMLRATLEQYERQVMDVLLLFGLNEEEASLLIERNEADILSSYGEEESPLFAANKIRRVF